MKYVDGFVLAVPATKKAEYLSHAEAAAEVFKKNGALAVVEGWGDDVPEGELTSLPMAVKCKEDETVCFSWIVWPNKEARDAGMEKAMVDPLFADENLQMPFDGKRMIFGGFEMLLER